MITLVKRWFPKPSILVQVKLGSPILIIFEMIPRLTLFPVSSCISFNHFPEVHLFTGGKLGEDRFTRNFLLINLKLSQPKSNNTSHGN
jgi:hypothetical protein